MLATIGSALDTVLDRTVLGGYTNLGYRLRRPGWDDNELQTMRGRVVLVTGATSGLGLAAAQGFGRLGATVWLVARDRERGERARARVAECCDGGAARLAMCDLSQLDSVRELAALIGSETDRLDVLVSNAGVMSANRVTTADGIELTFAVNVVAPFLLTELLADLLERSAPSRVVTVASGGMYLQRLRVDDLQSEHGDYNGTAAYARSKRAEVILTEMWAERLAARRIAVHAMHPGWADTEGVRSSLPGFYRATRRLLRTPAQGADTIVWLGSVDEAKLGTGGFWHDRRRRPAYLVPGTRESAADRERLWDACSQLSGAR
jgi:NAD(P)-dependent dehydrogenase (short-subunit alcohol dehydrogenase family)